VERERREERERVEEERREEERKRNEDELVKRRDLIRSGTKQVYRAEQGGSEKDPRDVTYQVQRIHSRVDPSCTRTHSKRNALVPVLHAPAMSKRIGVSSLSHVSPLLLSSQEYQPPLVYSAHSAAGVGGVSTPLVALYTGTFSRKDRDAVEAAEAEAGERGEGERGEGGERGFMGEEVCVEGREAGWDDESLFSQYSDHFSHFSETVGTESKPSVPHAPSVPSAPLYPLYHTEGEEGQEGHDDVSVSMSVSSAEESTGSGIGSRHSPHSPLFRALTTVQRRNLALPVSTEVQIHTYAYTNTYIY
jgi:hypothetical protein